VCPSSFVSMLNLKPCVRPRKGSIVPILEEVSIKSTNSSYSLLMCTMPRTLSDICLYIYTREMFPPVVKNNLYSVRWL